MGAVLLGMAIAGLALLATAILEGGGLFIVQTLLPFAILALVIPIAFRLARRSCREEFRPGRLVARLLVWSVAVAAGIAVLFAIYVAAMGGGAQAIWIVMVFVAMAGIAFAVQLPVFATALAVPFYRERLEALARPALFSASSSTTEPAAEAIL